jgi:hypothetical protein
MTGLYYIFVLVGEQRAKDRFFIRSQSEVNELVHKYIASRPNVRRTERETNPREFLADSCLFEKRRRLMAEWARYCASSPRGDVVGR